MTILFSNNGFLTSPVCATEFFYFTKTIKNE